MKILSVSDRVTKDLIQPGAPERYPGVELIIGCGDLPPEFLRELQARFDVPLYYVLGNHDIRHQQPITGCLDISRRIIRHNGISILGFSGSRWYNGNTNQYREKEMNSQIRKLWLNFRRHTRFDLVVTHAPPRFIHDAEDSCHKGFRCYRRLIDRYQPRYFVHGHIHTFFEKPEDRITVIGNTRVMNSYGFNIFEM